MEASVTSELILKYLDGTITTEETAEMEAWIHASAENQELFNELTNNNLLQQKLADHYKFRNITWEKIKAGAWDIEQPVVQRIHFIKRTWFRYAVAALIILALGTWLEFLQPDMQESPLVHTLPLGTDILPGSDKAVLTLSDGRQIQLDTSANALLAEKGISNENSLVAYSGSHPTGAINILTTPRGGQYKIKLSDGTIVWLNAASSISYPVAFIENQRKVTITGEAYFEVANDAVKPFIVQTYKDTITVLGTSFNVSSYAEEAGVKTSLLEGAVRIRQRTIRPGEAYRNGIVSKTNLEQDLAWKNGVFNFQHIRLAEAMRQLERWYDVDIRYDQSLSGIEFWGEMGRNLTLQQVVRGFEGMENMHFSLKGNILTVSR